MTMALVPACRRCPVPKLPLTTTVKALAVDSLVVEEKVHLCAACRHQALLENEAAKLRSTGKDVTK